MKYLKICIFFKTILVSTVPHSTKSESVEIIESNQNSIEPILSSINWKDVNISHYAASFCLSRNIFSCKYVYYSLFTSRISRNGEKSPTIFNAVADYKSFCSSFIPLINGTNLADALHSSHNMASRTSLFDVQLLVLVSHYEEDLSWLTTITMNRPVPFLIVSKSLNSPETLYISTNKGNEVSSYLTYIIKYYDNLPIYTLFLHGHNEHWHQYCNIRFIIDNFNFQDLYKNINNIQFSNSWRINKMNGLRSIWPLLFEKDLGSMPDTFEEKCCSQFFVHRDKIRLRSRIFYEQILDYVMTKDVLGEDGYHYEMSYYLEYLWHYIFGENAVMNPLNNVNNYEIAMSADHEYGKIYYYL